MVIKYKIEKLRLDFWEPQGSNLMGNFPDDFVDEYREVGRLKDRIYQQIREINLLTCRRMDYINQYRELMEKLRNGVSDNSLEKEQIKLYELIIIDTESYFIYAKLLLDKLVDIVKHYDKSLKVKNNFTAFQEEIIKNGYQDKKLENHIKNNTKWFELMIRAPRNIIFVHDFKTTGSGGGDHGIDFGITKSTEKRDAQKPTDKLRRMKKDHLTDFPELENEKISFQIIRVFDHNSEKLSWDEINEVKQLHEQIGGMFPYPVKVNKKLQELLDFFADWTKDKILKSKLSPHIP